ncbi:MAG: IS110 family transposase [Firmicutes bacterium]|nr:IS110 family transposase [Bacillota bacterium]MBR0209414.1 IS110 family transposase [Bacillota bacterium]
MKYTQNEKIKQVTENTLVIGIDVGSEVNFARAFDWRGMEETKRVFRFSNDTEGFNALREWSQALQEKTAKTEVLMGCEPTGHYWFPLARYLKEQRIRLVVVNPYHVKQLKELDDNSPKKTDLKDPKTIAKLVVEGRYSEPYLPEGIYADLREAVSSRERILKELNAASNRIQRWLKIYFPEYLKVYKKFDAESGLMVLEKAPLPEDVISLGAEGVNRIWRTNRMRAVGMKRAMTLAEAAHDSAGVAGGACARMELQLLLEDYRTKKNQLCAVTEVLETETLKVPNVKNILAIKGIGIVTIAGFLAEVGDIRRFTSPKQIQKLAGLELKETSSGKHKGRSSISKRGRKRLRKLLFQAVLPMLRCNSEIREVYEYYTTRLKNPLKGKQAVVAVSCKLIRIFWSLLRSGNKYDAERLQVDIIRPGMLQAA